MEEISVVYMSTDLKFGEFFKKKKLKSEIKLKLGEKTKQDRDAERENEKQERERERLEKDPRFSFVILVGEDAEEQPKES